MEQNHALYRLFGADGTLLYTGVALQPFARMGQHRREKSWWGEVATVTIEHHDSRADALAAERAAIKAEKPLYNVVHNRDAPPVICTYTTWENGGLITLYNVAPIGQYAKCWRCGCLSQITGERIKRQPKPPEVGPHGGGLPCPGCGWKAETNVLSDNGADEYPGRVECLT
jgi:predicted GIY-YIG superfamily endonuclease